MMESAMVTTRQQALEIAAKARPGLEAYLWRPPARRVSLRLRRTRSVDARQRHRHRRHPGRDSQPLRRTRAHQPARRDLSLECDTVVLFFFAEETDFQAGRFGIHRAIKEEGIAA